MTNAWELTIYYLLMTLVAVSCLVQIGNVRRALRGYRSAQAQPVLRAAGVLLTRGMLRSELLRLVTHVGLFLTLGWLIVGRWHWFVVPQPVTFGVFIAGFALVPITLLLMSWITRRTESQLRAMLARRTLFPQADIDDRKV